MRVLILSESSARSRYWEAALPLLRERGIDVCYGTVRELGEIHGSLGEKGIDVVSFGAVNSRDYPSVIYRIRKFARQRRLDLMHGSEAIPAVIAGMSSLVVRNPRCVFHRHHTYAFGVQSRLSKVASALSTLVMAVSESSRDAAVECDQTPVRKTRVVYNGIEPLRIVSDLEVRELRASLGIQEYASIVTNVGRLSGEKGHRTLFSACAIASERIPVPLHLVVVGDGEEMTALFLESQKFDGFKIHFVGHQQDIAPWFALGDVTAVPSYAEAFGLVAGEAMMCGKPVIASDVGGLKEVVGSNGVLVPPHDEQALADALMNMYRSPERAKEIGENGRKRVLEMFTMQKMVDGWIDCYDDALNQ
jgi:glycosyltransferase involved in cell wall biosynthesis